MNILNIEHVSKVFGEKVVLDDVSYGVHQGDKIGNSYQVHRPSLVAW